MANLSGLPSTGKRIATEFSEKNVTLMAAGIAYNAFVSLAPLLLLFLLIAGLFGGSLERRIPRIIQHSFPTPIANVMTHIFQGGSTSTTAGASIIGLVVLIWGSLKIFRSLDTAFSEIYESEAENTITDQIKDGIVVLSGLIVAILMILGVSLVFSTYSDTVPFLGLLIPLVLIGGIIVAFFPMYYLFPDRDLDWKEVLPGTVFAAVGWGILQSLFQVYLAFKGGGTTSAFSGIVLVITWLYFSGLVLLLGAVVNAVVGGYSSGAPGGVGQGATSQNKEREIVLNQTELTHYLCQLREQVTGRYEGMRPIGDTGEVAQLPRLDGKAKLTEYSVSKDDKEEWIVTLHWQADSGSTKQSAASENE